MILPPRSSAPEQQNIMNDQLKVNAKIPISVSSHVTPLVFKCIAPQRRQSDSENRVNRDHHRKAPHDCGCRGGLEQATQTQEAALRIPVWCHPGGDSLIWVQKQQTNRGVELKCACLGLWSGHTGLKQIVGVTERITLTFLHNYDRCAPGVHENTWELGVVMRLTPRFFDSSFKALHQDPFHLLFQLCSDSAQPSREAASSAAALPSKCFCSPRSLLSWKYCTKYSIKVAREAKNSVTMHSHSGSSAQRYELEVSASDMVCTWTRLSTPPQQSYAASSFWVLAKRRGETTRAASHSS